MKARQGKKKNPRHRFRVAEGYAFEGVNATAPRSELEADVRAERDSQVVVRPVSKKYLVRDIKAHTDRSEMPLKATAWVKHAREVIVAKVADSSKEVADCRGAIAKVEVYETSLELHKRMDMPVFAEIDLGPELAMQDANAGTVNGDGAG